MSGDRPASPGELWSARASDWAQLQEAQHWPKYEHAIDSIDVGPGAEVLDLGCGAGTFCRLAGEAGAAVTGIDAAPGLIDLARALVPQGRFDCGDLRDLPYPENTFTRLTAFNSLQFVSDPDVALAEVSRVAKPEALVYVLVWGRPERMGLMATMEALHPLLPPRPAGSGGPLALTAPGVLERLMSDGGLEVLQAGYTSMPYVYPDESTMLRAQCSSAPAVLAARTVGEDKVRAAISAAMAPFRTGTSFRISTEYRFVIGRVGR